MRRLAAGLLAALFPSGVQCLSCGASVRQEGLCEVCREALDRLVIRERTDDVMSVWWHEDQARVLVHRLKYEGVEDVAALLAQEIAGRLPPLVPDTVITWTPASDRRRRERGVDHARLLAEALSARTGLPARQLLRRTGERSAQQGLDRAQRLKNAVGAFAPVGSAERVLLVDDVLTTGATVRACAAALRSGGAKQVIIVTANKTKKASGGPGIQ